MTALKHAMLVLGVLVASFAGGAFAHWARQDTDAYAATQAKKPVTIRAQAFEVVDMKGNLLVRLSVTPDGPLLSMKRAHGRDTLGLGFGGEGVGLGISPRPNGSRIAVAASTDGKYGGMDIWDGRGEKVVTLGTAKPKEAGG